jgi:hypothetical protein
VVSCGDPLPGPGTRAQGPGKNNGKVRAENDRQPDFAFAFPGPGPWSLAPRLCRDAEPVGTRSRRECHAPRPRLTAVDCVGCLTVSCASHAFLVAHSSRGLGRRPLTAVTRVQIPYALPTFP